MTFHIFAVGKPKLSYVTTGLDEYLRRFPSSFEVNLHFLKASHPEGEAKSFLEATPKMRRVLLDEKGKSYSSRAFAEQLQTWYEQHPLAIAFMIGSADGHANSLRKETPHLISLSTLTFPHEMALLLLSEQLYRAHSILSRHPYHRD
ncbi:MAG: 23S rRNA (pseudouridine(1915)-N(3))-methyltransferase RlmH [Verrucomicrobiota bacterium]